jgi:4a-hydroxytetrahydrobiopterin dehydratase
MRLTDDQINARLPRLPGWSRQGAALARLFPFHPSADAVSFLVRLAIESEANDHHPDVHWSYRKVTVNWTTHSDAGITEKDFNGAQSADRIASTAFLKS